MFFLVLLISSRALTTIARICSFIDGPQYDGQNHKAANTNPTRQFLDTRDDRNDPVDFQAHRERHDKDLAREHTNVSSLFHALSLRCFTRRVAP
ncbi:hypothetical protein [Sorangium sp. So ce1097]|uniref:hypothetical protein n=1 Tax=Sorangium sp. So ce1097 TaxID=3133330 RepID=UPI003F63C1B9